MEFVSLSEIDSWSYFDWNNDSQNIKSGYKIKWKFLIFSWLGFLPWKKDAYLKIQSLLIISFSLGYFLRFITDRMKLADPGSERYYTVKFQNGGLLAFFNPIGTMDSWPIGSWKRFRYFSLQRQHCGTVLKHLKKREKILRFVLFGEIFLVLHRHG